MDVVDGAVEWVYVPAPLMVGAIKVVFFRDYRVVRKGPGYTLDDDFLGLEVDVGNQVHRRVV